MLTGGLEGINQIESHNGYSASTPYSAREKPRWPDPLYPKIKDLRGIRQRGDIIETKSKTNRQLLLEIEELRTRLGVAQRPLQEANELLQVQIAERKRAGETFEKVYYGGFRALWINPLGKAICGTSQKMLWEKWHDHRTTRIDFGGNKQGKNQMDGEDPQGEEAYTSKSVF
jgi:hypothetical protein